MRWFLDAVGEGRRRGLGLRQAVRFLRGQVVIRGKNLLREAAGVAVDLVRIRRPGRVLLLAHVDRVSSGGLIEAGFDDLRDRFIAEVGATVVHSRLGYRLRARRAQAVFSLEPFTSAPPARFSPRHRSVVLVADTWDKTWMARHLTRCRATRIISPYTWWVAQLPALQRTGEERWTLFPWWAPDVVVDGRVPRSGLGRDVSVVGALGPMYDLREWAAGLPMVTDVLAVSAYARDTVRHAAGPYFALLAERSAIVVAFGSDEWMRVPVAKYVEVPAVGSLLVGARAHHLDEMGFRDGENCLLFEGREDLERRLDAYLADLDSCVAIAARGLELVRDRHTTSHRLRTLRELLGV